LNVEERNLLGLMAGVTCCRKCFEPLSEERWILRRDRLLDLRQHILENLRGRPSLRAAFQTVMHRQLPSCPAQYSSPYR
jgi:hypothetical protein